MRQRPRLTQPKRRRTDDRCRPVNRSRRSGPSEAEQSDPVVRGCHKVDQLRSHGYFRSRATSNLRQQNPTQNRRWQPLFRGQPAFLFQSPTISRVLDKDGIEDGEEKPDEDADECQTADTGGPASGLLEDDGECAEEHLQGWGGQLFGE